MRPNFTADLIAELETDAPSIRRLDQLLCDGADPWTVAADGTPLLALLLRHDPPHQRLRSWLAQAGSLDNMDWREAQHPITVILDYARRTAQSPHDLIQQVLAHAGAPRGLTPENQQEFWQQIRTSQGNGRGFWDVVAAQAKHDHHVLSTIVDFPRGGGETPSAVRGSMFQHLIEDARHDSGSAIALRTMLENHAKKGMELDWRKDPAWTAGIMDIFRINALILSVLQNEGFPFLGRDAQGNTVLHAILSQDPAALAAQENALEPEKKEKFYRGMIEKCGGMGAKNERGQALAVLFHERHKDNPSPGMQALLEEARPWVHEQALEQAVKTAGDQGVRFRM